MLLLLLSCPRHLGRRFRKENGGRIPVGIAFSAMEGYGNQIFVHFLFMQHLDYYLASSGRLCSHSVPDIDHIDAILCFRVSFSRILKMNFHITVYKHLGVHICSKRCHRRYLFLRRFSPFLWLPICFGQFSFLVAFYLYRLSSSSEGVGATSIYSTLSHLIP